MKKPILLFLSALLLVSSCSLFLGPLGNISLMQRLNKGWKKIFEFNNSYAMVPDIGNSKLLITKVLNEFRAYYWVGNFSTRNLFYFTTNSSGIQVGGPFATTSFQNKMDVTRDLSNNALVFLDDATYAFRHYYNNFVNSWFAPNSTNTMWQYSSLLVADVDQVVGVNPASTSNSVVKAQFNNPGSAVYSFIPNANGINLLSKCRNKYNNDTVLFTVYYDPASPGNNMLQMFTLNNFNSFMMSTPMPIVSFMSPIMESDGSNRLYMVLNGGVYRFDGSTKSFVKEATLPGSLLANSTNCAADFIDENLMILNYDPYAAGSSVNLMTYNTAEKKYFNYNLMEIPANEQVLGIDLYYDRTTYTLYAAVMLYNNLSMQLHGVLYMNQMQ